MNPFTFETKLDVGHFLTFLTLTAGFFWWIYTSIRSWRNASNEDAQSGALRLLLKILRKSELPYMNLEQLYGKFHSDEMKESRKSYCGRDYKFKSYPIFEAAIYQLDWEGKIDFPSPNLIAFRVDGNANTTPRFIPTKPDIESMLQILRETISDKDTSPREIESAAESCLLVAQAETTEIIREALNSSNNKVAQRVLPSLRRLLPPHA